MSLFGLVHDPIFAEHIPHDAHPERPERWAAVHSALTHNGWTGACTRIEPRAARDEELRRIHTPEYITRLREACRRGEPQIDCVDSSICRESERVARLAAGAAIDIALEIARGALRRGFCAVRPPGHHAEANYSMGFCLYNNIALAAAALREAGGLQRIAIVDWDVHHGNGTQHSFDDDPSVLFISLHGHPDYLYPGTGQADECGRGAGHGYTLNVPLLPGADDTAYRAAVESHVLPKLEAFRPEVVLISAGFDAHRDDPLGNLRLESGTFAWFTRALLACAERHAGGRVLSILEGGYNLDALTESVTAHLNELFADSKA